MINAYLRQHSFTLDRTKSLLVLLSTFFIIMTSSCQNQNTNKGNSEVVDLVSDKLTFADIVDSNQDVVKLVDSMNFLEGPIWDAKNNRLIFSEVMANKLHQWSAKNDMEIFLSPSGYAGGNTLDQQGNIISCQGGARQIARLKPDKSIEVLTNNFEGRKFNSPNDVAIKSDGTIWFTDPDYGLLAAYGEKADEHRELDAYHIFKFDPQTGQTVSVNNTLSKPNGLVFSQDESELFVGNSNEGDRKLVVFEVTAQNMLANMKTLAKIESKSWGIDGLKNG